MNQGTGIFSSAFWGPTGSLVIVVHKVWKSVFVLSFAGWNYLNFVTEELTQEREPEDL